MLLEHQVTKELAVAAKMKQSAKNISSQAILTRWWLLTSKATSTTWRCIWPRRTIGCL
jgi:hypothetical protein